MHAPARPADLTFPFNQRWTMRFWNLAFLDEHRFRPDPARSAEANRGAYLATALGHCGECHTPRNFAFALRPSKQFAGTLLQGWNAYNICPDRRSGIGGWSDAQVADYLGTGHAQDRGSAAGPMGEAVSNSLQYLSAQDITALVAYLKTVKPQPGRRTPPAHRQRKRRREVPEVAFSRAPVQAVMSGTAKAVRRLTQR